MSGRWSFGGAGGNAFQAVMIGLEEPEGLALDIFSESLCRAVAGHDWETFGFPFTQVFEPSVLYEVALIQGIEPLALATLEHRPTATTERLAAVVAAPEVHPSTALVNAASILTCASRFARASELVEHAATRSPSGREAFELDWLRFVVSNRTDDGASSPTAFARMQAVIEAGDVPPSRAMDACTQAVVWYVKRREIPAETFRWFARHGAELSAQAGVLTSGGLSAWYRGLAMVPAATGQPAGARRYMEKALEAAEVAEQTNPGADARNARKTYFESTIKEHLYVTGDLDAALQAMHDHLRKSVFMPQPRGRGGWVESGLGPEVEITPEQVMHAIDVAAELGAEVFFVDASWYARPGGNWWRTVGDWDVDLNRFPEGIKPFRDHAHEKGLLWGLWMDAERIGEESRIFGEHPDWLAAGYDGQRNLGGLLDLTKPEVADWMEAQITRVIEENELEFFRLDHNTHPGPGLQTRRDGYVENGYLRYFQQLYAIYDRLRGRFPEVIFENCAGGGGRSDVGLVRRFSHTWVTDWQIAPRSFAITNGMSMALPPEYVDRLVGGQSGCTTADIDFQNRLLLFVRPTVGFSKPMGAEWNPVQLERLKRFIDLYKSFVRPFMSTGRIYHHTPCVSNPEPQGWGVLELASRERDRAICGLFQLAAPVAPEYVVRLRGLDRSRRYRLTFDNTGQTAEVDGLVLMHQGLTVRLEGALTSELLVVEAL